MFEKLNLAEQISNEALWDLISEILKESSKISQTEAEILALSGNGDYSGWATAIIVWTNTREMSNFWATIKQRIINNSRKVSSSNSIFTIFQSNQFDRVHYIENYHNAISSFSRIQIRQFQKPSLKAYDLIWMWSIFKFSFCQAITFTLAW